MPESPRARRTFPFRRSQSTPVSRRNRASVASGSAAAPGEPPSGGPDEAEPAAETGGEASATLATAEEQELLPGPRAAAARSASGTHRLMPTAQPRQV